MFKYILKNYYSLLQLNVVESLPSNSEEPWIEKPILGFLWWGQIASHWILAAENLGYDTVVFSAEWPLSSAAQLSKQVDIVYTDVKKAADIIVGYWINIIIPEWENPPEELLTELENRGVTVACGSTSFWQMQHRGTEKEAIVRAWAEVVDYIDSVNTKKELLDAFDKLWAWIVKTARMGYDSKWQEHINSRDDVSKLVEKLEQESRENEEKWELWIRLWEIERIYEKKVKIEWEISFAVWRNEGWEMCVFDPAYNIHEKWILKTSTIPAWENDDGVDITDDLLNEGKRLAKMITEKMWIVGLLVVEMFIVDWKLIINELAPRGHNSYHQSSESHNMSQYEAQIKAICNESFGELKLLKKAILTNMLWNEINQMGDNRKTNKGFVRVVDWNEVWIDYWKDIDQPDTNLPVWRKMWHWVKVSPLNKNNH